MPNPYHFRAAIDRLWRYANSDAPGYRQVAALDAIVRELHAPTEQARRNYRMYLATDPFDVARHLLRDLYDRDSESISPPASSGGRCHGVACPALDAGTEGGSPVLTQVAPAQAGDAPTEDEPPEEDDDPL